MRVSIELDNVNKFETDLVEKDARELFNDFVFSAMSKRNTEEMYFSDYEDEYNFNTTGHSNRKSENTRRFNYPRLKGFVYLECAKCGRRHGFCVNKEMSHYICDDCGYDTTIDNSKLRRIRLDCENCGKSYLYTTNITEEKPQMQCFSCGDIKNLFYFKRDNIYYIDKEV